MLLQGLLLTFTRVVSVATDPAVEEVLFECFMPTEHPAIPRVIKPLPFSSSVTENLAWAVAFIDRAGHLTEVGYSFQIQQSTEQ